MSRSCRTHVALRLRQLFREDGLDGLGHLGIQTAAGFLLALLPVCFLQHHTKCHFLLLRSINSDPSLLRMQYNNSRSVSVNIKCYIKTQISVLDIIVSISHSLWLEIHQFHPWDWWKIEPLSHARGFNVPVIMITFPIGSCFLTMCFSGQIIISLAVQTMHRF